MTRHWLSVGGDRMQQKGRRRWEYNYAGCEIFAYRRIVSYQIFVQTDNNRLAANLANFMALASAAVDRKPYIHHNIVRSETIETTEEYQQAVELK
eukprot:scaffold346896_cov36-Prasinocladus_malaysianus.AAC.1